MTRTFARYKRRAAGFSLVELLVVIAVVLIIAAFALPRLLQSKQAANESIVKARLASVSTSEATYRTSMGRNVYATLAQLRSTQAGGVPLISPSEVDSNGNPIANGGWVLSQIETPTDTTFGFGMTDTFKKSPNQYCVYEDGVVRVDCCQCTRSSAPVTGN